MRTLKEIDAAVFEIAKKKAAVPNIILKPQDIVNISSQFQFNDKYREMHSILQDVEKFIYDTGNVQLQMRIAEKIKAL